MASKLHLNKLQQISNDEVKALGILNDNFKKIEEKIDTLLSRYSETPNEMETELDMDFHKIINVSSGTGDNDVVVRKDFVEYIERANELLNRIEEVLTEAEGKVQQTDAFARESKIWAEGDDEDVQALGGTHSSMVSSGLSYAFANAPEDVTVEEWAPNHSFVIKGEKGDTGASATINGYTAVTLQSGDNLTITQNGSTLTLDVDFGPIEQSLDSINGEVI